MIFPGNANLPIGVLRLDIQENAAPRQHQTLAKNMAGQKTAVILRGCDFIDFSQKVALKTISLHAKKSRYLNKVTPSEPRQGPGKFREESLLRKVKDQERFVASPKSAAARNSSLELFLLPARVDLAETVPRIRHRKCAIRLRGHFDPVRRPIVLRRWGRGRTWRRRRHRSDRHIRLRVIDIIGDEHARRGVLLPAEKREMHLPEVFESWR